MTVSIADKVREWAERKKRFTEAQEAERRIAICRECRYHAGPLGTWCRLCGCNTHFKTHVAEAECPDNPPRWQKFQ
jgi:ribosomal protein L40E